MYLTNDLSKEVPGVSPLVLIFSCPVMAGNFMEFLVYYCLSGWITGQTGYLDSAKRNKESRVGVGVTIIESNKIEVSDNICLGL